MQVIFFSVCYFWMSKHRNSRPIFLLFSVLLESLDSMLGDTMTGKSNFEGMLSSLESGIINLKEILRAVSDYDVLRIHR